ncbi:Hpt domain-containing protein [Terasakiella pusilla]|jgi:HPt (histidine-containing phosphotransfer) domain-containing protein|uniref:Hpt domain-containing protein n=1 Tax=Terasakiella pusilla TaxID=64973 RepID=UPI003AA87639
MQDDIQNKLALMQQNFRQKLWDVASDLQTWQTADRFDDLLFLTHKYAGSAGTFGLGETSERLKEFELKLKQLPHPISDEEAIKLYQEASALLGTEQKND